MRTLITTFICVSSTIVLAQLPKDQVQLFWFGDAIGNDYYLATDTKKSFLKFRVQKGPMVEFEFPADEGDTWGQFSYSYYLRGGGPDNAGLDLNYVYFTLDSTKYVIYDVHSAERGDRNIGLRKISLQNGREEQIIGMPDLVEGHLMQFRDHPKMMSGEETFD